MLKIRVMTAIILSMDETVDEQEVLIILDELEAQNSSS